MLSVTYINLRRFGQSWAKTAGAVSRHPGNDGNLLKAQYDRLADALDGYYAGKKEQVLNVAATMRVLINDKPGTSSRSLLYRLNPAYWDLPIYDKLPPHPHAILTIHTPIALGGGSPPRILRPQFDGGLYHLVPLSMWWKGDYQALGGKWLSKETIVLTVADKDGGAHVDDKLPETYAFLSQPSVRYGTEVGGHLQFVQPNLAFDTTALVGCELQEFLERHFPFVK